MCKWKVENEHLISGTGDDKLALTTEQPIELHGILQRSRKRTYIRSLYVFEWLSGGWGGSKVKAMSFIKNDWTEADGERNGNNRNIISFAGI